MGKRIVIDDDSGEIVNEIMEGDKIVKSGTIDFLNETQTWRIERYFKGSMDEARALMMELSSSEKAFLFCASAYVGYTDCCIKHDNGKVFDIVDFVSLSGLSRATVFRVLDSLRKKDIIFKGKNSNGDLYFINPWIYCRGNRISGVLKTMFKNYKIRVINKRWRDI